MFGWFKSKSTLTDDQRDWIDARFEWLLNEFGRDRLLAPVVTPTVDFFPGSSADTEEDIARLFHHICDYMDVDPKRLELRFYTDVSADEVVVALTPGMTGRYSLGSYEEKEGRTTIWIERTRLGEPDSIVATIAHELGHVHLLGDRRYSDEMDDHEPLTDLLTVYFGLGIFSANNVIREVNWRHGSFSGSSASWQGYLSAAHYAYALAVYTSARNEESPAWWRHLRPDIRAWLKTEYQSLSQRTRCPAEATPTFSPNRPSEADFESESADAAERTSNAHRATEHATSDDQAIDARTEFEITLDGMDSDELYSLGVELFNAESYALAIEVFSEALRLEPADCEIRQHRANVLFADGQFSRVVKDCTIILDHDSAGDDAVPAYRSRGAAFVYLRNFSNGVDDLTLALKANSKDAQSYFYRGLAHFGQHDHRLALADFNNAIRYAPMWSMNYLARGRTLDSMGSTDRAKNDLAKAISLEPELADESLRRERLANIGL